MWWAGGSGGRLVRVVNALVVVCGHGGGLVVLQPSTIFIYRFMIMRFDGEKVYAV